MPGRVPTPEEVLQSPTTSQWLKDALRAALNRDCVDASHDGEVLAMILSQRCDDALGIRFTRRTR